MKLETLLDEAARGRIASAVRAAEARSEGQIVPVLVARATHHSEALYRASLAGAALATLALWWTDAAAPLAVTLTYQTIGLLAGAVLSSVSAIERLLLGKRALAEASWQRAERAFLEHHLGHTGKRTGVLVFASLFERQAIVLGDEGIHAKMGDEGWRAAVTALTAGLRAGKPADGFCAAIALCGDKLAAAFPRKAASPGNELPDALQVEKS